MITLSHTAQLNGYCYKTQIQFRQNNLQTKTTRRVAVCLWTHCNIGSKRALRAATWRVTLNRQLLFSFVRPPPKLTQAYRRQILGMSTSPRNDSHYPKLCRLSCSLITNIPSKVPILAKFWTCKSPCAEIRKIITGVHMRTPIHVFYFKNCQNRCRVSGRKSALYWLKKQFLTSLGATPGAISP